MADGPLSTHGSPAVSKPPAAPQAEGNPAFRAMGLPRISKWKLPSRNWLIFLSITGAWTTTLLYDRYHKRRAQKKWCEFVSHLADEPLPNSVMPRKITIVLAAPPGDGLRPAREHFHEYIKPILVAGAVDWEVIEGRREGEVRAGLAKKIRKLRRRRGEKVPAGAEEDEEEQDLVREAREKLGISDWSGVQGDLILGRHTWKEYLRGLHEGWLGPLVLPQKKEALETSSESPTELPLESTMPAAAPEAELPQVDAEETPSSGKEAEKPPDKPHKPSLTLPFISTNAYTTASTAPTIPQTLSPSLPLQLPHLLGLKYTPTRLYRFLTRRYLADETGAHVAALVLAVRSRAYSSSTSFISPADPDSQDASSTVADDNVVVGVESWEQEELLKDEERGWHKSAWKEEELKEGEEKKERTWTEKMVIDPRIGSRMQIFQLPEDARLEATKHAEEMRKKEPSLLEQARKYIGWEKQARKGWEMGDEGDEFS